MKDIYIVSFYGIGNKGGVERVNYYLFEILSKKFNVKLIEAPLKNQSKISILLNPILVWMKLVFKKNKFIISNSWQLYPYKSDISIHHGTTAGIVKYLNEKKSIGKFLIAKFEKKSAKNAKNILAVSQNCKNELMDLYQIDNSKITVINNFVDDSIFYPVIKENDGILNVLFVGSLTKRKGSDFLKEFALYIQNKNDVKLFIATNSSVGVTPFENLSNTKIYIGLNINEIAELYRRTDVLYFPTRYEGFSMSTLEALSSGLPVLGSNFAVTDELISYDFCKKIDNFTPEYVYNQLKILKSEFENKKYDIHETIKMRFGTNEYQKKIIDYINKYI